MNAAIRILIVEHNIFDLELIQYELKKGGIDFVSEVVENEHDYINALKKFVPDIILSDHSLPSFSGETAFNIRQEIASDIPFIFVSGSFGEEKSVELIKSGLTDYVLKDKLFQLTAKVKRALKEFEEEKLKKITARELAQSESRLARAQQLAHLGSWELDITTNKLIMSQEGCNIFNVPYEQNFLTFEAWTALVHPDDLEDVLQTIKASKATLSDAKYHHRVVLKSGEVKHIFSESKFELDSNGKATGMYGTMQDITEKKLGEEQKEFDGNNLKALINNTADLMWSVDREFNLITSNQRFDEMVRTNLGLHIGKGDNVLDVVCAPEVINRFKAQYERAFAGDSFTQIELFTDPLEMWSEISYSPIHKGEKIIGAACYLRDITGRKKHEEQQELFESIVNSSDDAVLSKDLDGIITTWNEGAEKIFGYSSKEIIGSHISILIPPYLHVEESEMVGKIRGGRDVLHYETQRIRKDKKIIYVAITSSPLKDVTGKIIGASKIARDITDQKRIQEERERIAADLIQHNKDLEQFSYIVSHNLRLPVANIIGFADILVNEDISDEEKKEFTGALMISVKKLDDVVSDLNQVLQVRKETDEMKEPVCFSDLVKNIEESIGNVVKKEEARLITDFSEIDMVSSLKGYMYSVFFNLINNSFKFRQKDVPLVIKIKSRIEENKVILSFKDNGSGIDMGKNSDHVFKLYKRFHSKIEGKGMGLFMVKTQLDTLGGKIRVNSEVNKGTEFIIEFEKNRLIAN